MNNIKKGLPLLLTVTLACTEADSQFADYVKAKISAIDSERVGVLRMSRKDNHVKIKYFAAKDDDGTSVYERYQRWAAGKKIIAYSSGAYMNNCPSMSASTPIGICIDQGKIVNRDIMKNNLDALVVIYPTGGMRASNLDNKNLKNPTPSGMQAPLDIRGNSYHMMQFLRWAEEYEVTVFQTHLYAFEDTITIFNSESSKARQRRLLAVCRSDTGDVIHYLLNFPGSVSEYNATLTAFRVLKEIEEMQKVIFIINLESGCENIFSTYNEKGKPNTSIYLKGSETLSKDVSNLLVYYFE